MPNYTDCARLGVLGRNASRLQPPENKPGRTSALNSLSLLSHPTFSGCPSVSHRNPHDLPTLRQMLSLKNRRSCPLHIINKSTHARGASSIRHRTKTVSSTPHRPKARPLVSVRALKPTNSAQISSTTTTFFNFPTAIFTTNTRVWRLRTNKRRRQTTGKNDHHHHHVGSWRCSVFFNAPVNRATTFAASPNDRPHPLPLSLFFMPNHHLDDSIARAAVCITPQT